MSGHTPGPWEWLEAKTAWEDPANMEFIIGGGPNNDDIAAVFHEEGATVSISREEAAANARLIAAAPSLLSALQALDPFMDAIVCYASTLEEHEPNRLVMEARAAIAKATGETDD